MFEKRRLSTQKKKCYSLYWHTEQCDIVFTNKTNNFEAKQDIYTISQIKDFKSMYHTENIWNNTTILHRNSEYNDAEDWTEWSFLVNIMKL